MNALKKSLTGILFIILMFNMITLPASSSQLELDFELELSAQAAVLIEAETGKILYEKNATEPLPPASLTKIMTLLVAMEEMEQGRVDWDTVITASQRAWETRGSTMFLNIGQEATLREMIQGIAIVSANDACVAVAEHLYGSEAAFVQRMNQRAAELGLENTNFVNTHGLHDPEQYMSALDVARLASFFVTTQPEAAAYQAEREFTFNEIWQENRNPLLGSYPGADGVKTGSTPEAGMCLAASSIQQGMRLVSVVMNTPSLKSRGEESEVLLNYGFRNFELITFYEAGQAAVFVPVNRGQDKELALTAKRPVVAIAPRGDDSYVINEQLILNETLEAPVEAGQSIGTLRLVDSAGEVLNEIELFAAESVERLGFFGSVFRIIGDFFTGLWDKARGDEK